MPNLWRQFEDLLPDAPLLVGTVVTRHADDTVSVQLLGGGSCALPAPVSRATACSCAVPRSSAPRRRCRLSISKSESLFLVLEPALRRVLFFGAHQ